MERICGGSERIEEALVFLRIGSTPRTFLRTRSTVRALVPARCPPGPRRTVSSPATAASMGSQQNPACPRDSPTRLVQSQSDPDRRVLLRIGTNETHHHVRLGVPH